MPDQAEIVVVGLGPGGEDLAESLAEQGLDVVGIDGRLVGGECPYWGCVPSKMMLRAAELLAEGRRIPGMAGQSTVSPDWGPVERRIREEATDNWDDRVAVERFEQKGGRFVRGMGRIEAPDRVSVGQREIRASRALVVNTGTEPWIPRIPGLADVPYWTNREAIEAEVVPPSLIVLGGGAVGVELGQVFARFGSKVTVIEGADHLLPPEEPESGELLEKCLEEEGISVLTSRKASAVRRDGAEIVVDLDGALAGDDGTTVRAAQLLVATGRRSNLEALGVANLGLDPEAGTIPVDEYLRVVPGVWAIGDVTGKGAFTHISMYQARIARASILGEDVDAADYRAVPHVTFTDPEIASVGLTEVAAREHGLSVRIGLTDISSSARGWIHKAGNAGFIKLVEDAERGVLVGATSAGPMGGEVLAMLAVAVHAEVPTDRLRTMIYAYPTFHRAVEAALADLSD